jgi:hypothetical protein
VGRQGYGHPARILVLMTVSVTDRILHHDGVDEWEEGGIKWNRLLMRNQKYEGLKYELGGRIEIFAFRGDANRTLRADSDNLFEARQPIRTCNAYSAVFIFIAK